MLIPLWESAAWWRLVALDVAHFAEAVVDWVWLPRSDPDLFVPGTAPGRAVGARLDVNRKDPVEMALALDMQKFALAVVADSSAGKYIDQFNRFCCLA